MKDIYLVPSLFVVAQFRKVCSEPLVLWRTGNVHTFIPFLLQTTSAYRPWIPTWIPKSVYRSISRATTLIVISSPPMTASFPQRLPHSHNPSSAMPLVRLLTPVPSPTTKHKVHMGLQLGAISPSTTNLSNQCQHTRLPIRLNIKASIKGRILQHHSLRTSNVKVDTT